MVSRTKDTHTTNRVVRVSDQLWEDYGAACEDEHVTRSEDVRAHMERKVRTWKRRKQTGGDEQGHNGG